MIQVDKLCKSFGRIQAVDNISFDVEKGEILGFLGPNGAGKSTTMKMITCFIPPSSGTAKVCGHDILKNPLKVRENVGYLPESAPSYHEMLVEEFLLFAGEMRGLKGSELHNHVDRVLDQTSLQEVRFQMIDTLSKGYRQRTCLAQSLLHDPPVLILDEPTDGLDPNQKHEVRTLIKRISEKRAILVSTHILEEVEAVCSRAIIIADGKVVADGTPEDLLARSSFHNAISLTVKKSDPEGLLSKLQNIPGVQSAQVLNAEAGASASFILFPKQGQIILSGVEQFIQEQQLQVEQLYSEKGRLDEVFRKVTLNV
ncbi:MAG: ATP-binding cassette domain-containing protein [SAR324 cluster bacterium]|nr:ATP-binding cassette domain-containing protein [SAR324 cluster bacterium]